MDGDSEKEDKFVLIEKTFKMNKLEQYVHRVVDCSSRFNNSNSYSYAPVNIVGKYVKYPTYGDFPEAYILRSYGIWWKKSSAYQPNYRPQDFDPLGAEDYIILEFGSAVVPRDVCVYEIYNPGAIVRVWGKLLGTELPWVLLWEGAPEKCPHKPRKFHPKIRNLNCLINTIRLEFNQSGLEYHTSIDAVLLTGYQPISDLQYSMIMKGLINIKNKCNKDEKYIEHCQRICDITSDNVDHFSVLPYEVILDIFQYLDLKSLSRCAQVNRRWYEVCADPTLYQNISLRNWWYLIDCDNFNFFIKKCNSVKMLDLSWCGNEGFDFRNNFLLFIKINSPTLTHLSLSNCSYLNNELMGEISNCTQLMDVRIKNTSNWFNSSLHNLNKIVSLDLTSTNIEDGDLIKILKSNPNLKHIIVDLCENLTRLDQVMEVVSKYNNQLITWSSWKTTSLTSEGIKLFGNCPNLEELDLGWCLLTTDPGICLKYIALGCRKLKRLILSEWRALSDTFLMPVILSCKEISQLDLLGLKNISTDVCQRALLLLPKLRLLEISFCDAVSQDEVNVWKQQYPHITIQRSCQYVVTDYLN